MARLASLLVLFAILVRPAAAAPPPTTLQPFPLQSVRLLDGPCKTAMEADRKYLLALDSDRLLYAYRKNAGLPAPGEPLGGWESPDWKPYPRGAFLGHYLSACALLYASTGDPAVKARADAIVAELVRCQSALGGGYLAAFPSSVYDKLENDQPGGGHPYYITHKMLAGLLDMAEYADNRQALQMARGMADYFKRRTNKLSDARMDRLMREEFGGMPDTLYGLSAATHDANYLALAHRFDQASFLGPLALQHDNLTEVHANTSLPKVLGAAHRYDLLGEPDYKTLTTFFWDRVAGHRSYATGGSSSGEFWHEPDELAATLAPNTEETCTSYNMLKVTRALIRWTADPRYADFYERLFFNGLLPAQDPDDGQLVYFLPLAAGQTKKWGTAYGSFWCCYGTGVESFAKLGDSLYFHDDGALYVNLYVASELRWPSKGVRVVQQTRFPEEAASTFLIHAARPTRFDLRLHIPYWSRGATISINGQPQEVAAKPTSYASLRRVWKEGDVVRIRLPMRLHTQPMPDDPKLQAILYGPLVLAGLDVGEKPATLHEISPDPFKWLTPVPGKPLTFQLNGQGRDEVFVPLYKVISQRYSVYQRVEAAH